jgi:seryl-tRNA synthetase
MDSKENYRLKFEARLDEMKAELELLKAKANVAGTDLKIKYDREINKLEEKMSEGKSKLAELADASEEAWESIKGGADSIWTTMKSTFEDVKTKFKDEQ